MRNIRKTFPGVVALDRMHFDLREGEVHVLLGENGAGKSTLMKIISGAYRKDSGQVFLQDEEVEIKGPKHAQEMGIGIIYQELNLIPHLTAGENIFLGREPCKVPGVIDQKTLFASAQQILDKLGVSIDARTVVNDLGGAEQQMIEVAKALSLDATILIMDEPTSALTEQEIEELFKAIRRLKTKGVSVIYISHRMEEVFEIGDRVTVFRDGLYIGTETIGEVERDELIRMMVGRSLKEQFPKRKTHPGEEILRVEGLSRHGVLKDINFSLRRGEVLGISGLMGSGRTELARAIFGVDEYHAGTIEVHGKKERFKSPRQAISRGLGFLTEDRKSQGLVLVISVKDNICLPNLDRFSRFGVVDDKLEIEVAEKFCHDLRIKTPTLNQQVVHLSGGNQQKVVLSKLLCADSDILIFDEPTRGIDVGSKVEIYELMNELTAKGAGIIMISSELPEILGMSDRILVMSDGEVGGEFTSEEATQEAILQCALGGDK
jgi:ribose transport system ATP-binding protein